MITKAYHEHSSDELERQISIILALSKYPYQYSYLIRDKSLQRLWRSCCFKVLMDERTGGHTEDGQKVITIAHPEHTSGELIIPHLTFA